MNVFSASDASSENSLALRAKINSRFPYSPEFFPGIIRVFDVVFLFSAGVLLMAVGSHHRDAYISQHLFSVIFVSLVFNALSNWANLSSLKALMRPLGTAERIVVAVITCFMGLLSILFGLDVAFMVSETWLWLYFGFAVAGLLAIRFGAFHFLRWLSRRRVIGRNLAVLGVGAQSARLLRKISRDPPYFTALVGAFSPDHAVAPDRIEGVPVLGSIEDLLDHVRGGLVDDVVIAMPWNANQTVIDTIERMKELPVNVYLSTDLVGFDLEFQPVLGSFSQLPVFEVVQKPISGWGSALKVVMDYAIALAALIALSPLMLLIALAIRLDSPGPVLFRQERLGFNNRVFSIYKFRSMRALPEGEAVVRQATRNDPRVTRVGRIIRATSLDELPQLFNVLDGTMSLVGPRPHAVSHNEEYGRQIRGYFARHKVKPGITGWAQVNGLRGETPDIERMRRRIEHDIYYTENWSLALDVKILIMTVLVVFFQKTAY